MTDAALRARATLERRARLLAQPVQHEAGAQAAGARLSLLTVHLGQERVAIALDQIIEVHRAGLLTPIPGAHPPVVGVVAWRGRVLTVLDVASSRREPVAISDSTRILVIGQGRASFGIIVDDVEEVREVNTHDVLPVENVEPGRRDFIRGVLADAVVVLDAPGLIARFAATH